MQRSEFHFEMQMIVDSHVISDPNSKLSASLARFKKSLTET